VVIDVCLRVYCPNQKVAFPVVASRETWRLLVDEATVVLVVLVVVVALMGVSTVIAVFGMARLRSQVNNVSERLPVSEDFAVLSQRLWDIEQSSRTSYAQISHTLGGLAMAAQQMVDVGQKVSNLEDLLRPPKLRGGMGETLLGELLAQILPESAYRLQHRFNSGERVDAVICLGDALVPVDAKFPLESFRRLTAIKGEAEAARERKVFMRAVKTHIDEIAWKYILPDERTYDFALMYIPAENVYYETILKDDSEDGLFPFALEKRVIPVSPNSFYAYLQVIIHGLKGLQIESRAREIMDYLNRLKVDEGRFREEFDILGTHLQNAHKKYDDAQRRLDRFEDKLLSTAGIGEPAALERGERDRS
jgi:DNA recombination protein RmuC